MRSGDRMAFAMMSAVGVLVPSCFILLDMLGVPMPDLSAVDARHGLPRGLMSSILIASVALGVALIVIGFSQIQTSRRSMTPAMARREEFGGWLSVAAGANLPAATIIGLTSIAILF